MARMMGVLKARITRLAILLFAIAVSLVAAAPADATITSITPGQPTMTEGVQFSGTLATFITNDPVFGAPWTQSIDWGDGASSTGTPQVTGNNGTVSDSHIYNEDGTYTIHVMVTESGGGSPNTVSVDVTATVTDGDLIIVAEPPTTISEGTHFAGRVAQVVDSGSPDTASKFAATINWGDGTTSPGIVAGGSGNFMIGGSHTYMDELPHGFITVSVSEPDARTTVGPVDDQISVTEADALTAHPLTFSARDGTPFSGAVATFSDVSTTAPSSDFTATINWGDGTTTTGTVSGAGGTMTVSGNHTYHSPPSNYPATVILADRSPGSATATASSAAAVGPGRPSAVTGGANGVTIDGAQLNGTVNPDGGATSYTFQFGTTTHYGSTTPGRSAGFGNSGQAVSAPLSGLTPGKTYHYRVEATNAQGTTAGVDRTFTTAALVVSVRGRRNGSFLVVVNAPGAGTFDLTLMRGGRVVGHSLVKANRAGRLHLVVRLGARLMQHHPRHLAVSMKVTFRPPNATRTTVTLPGLHLPRA